MSKVSEGSERMNFNDTSGLRPLCFTEICSWRSTSAIDLLIRDLTPHAGSLIRRSVESRETLVNADW